MAVRLNDVSMFVFIFQFLQWSRNRELASWSGREMTAIEERHSKSHRSPSLSLAPARKESDNFLYI